jgi:hypothetical protein
MPARKKNPQGRVHRPRHRVKFPEVLRYANAVEEFLEETEEHVNWANALVDNICLGLYRKNYTRAEVYRELRHYHGEFQRLFDAMIRGEPAPDLMQMMTEHCGHIRRTYRYEYDQEPTDDEYWDELECQDAMFTGGPPPALRRRITRWSRRLEGLPSACTEPMDSPGHGGGSDDATRAADLPEERPSFEAFWKPKHPVDAMCEQVRLLCEKKTIEFLRKCEHCSDYFLAQTKRAQLYCDDWCRSQANRPPKKDNCQSVRECRDRKKQAFLRRIAAAKIRVRGLDPLSRRAAMEVLTLEEVLADVNAEDNMDPDELPISRRRWTELKKYEIRKYGKQRATDLTT